MPKVLVADDEPSIRFSIQQVFDGSDISVLTANNAQEALRCLRDEVPDVILLDIRLGSDDGLRVFEQLRQLDPKCLVVFITGHGNSETAIEAMKLGAFDYLVKPLDADQIVATVRQACDIRRLMCTPAIVDDHDNVVDNPDLIIGGGVAMRAVFKQIGRVTGQDINVLILGESGTGKELVARALYHHSRRSQQPFLAINCAALSETLLESELFGHEKGAFTGADRRRIGKFEQANGGTMFLDEVGDMSPNTQAKMLRLLQNGAFERVGGNESLHVKVRIIAATNKKLDAMINDGRFRLDLYYRLRGITIELPALRERLEDIPELAHYFVFRFNRELDTRVNSISEECLERLQQYSWPGNVRELQSVIRESLIRSAGPVLSPEFLPQHIAQATSTMVVSPPPGSVTWSSMAADVQAAFNRGETGIYRRAVEQLDQLLVVEALAKSNGSQAVAAQILGLSRPTLRGKIRLMSGAKSTISESAEMESPERG